MKSWSGRTGEVDRVVRQYGQEFILYTDIDDNIYLMEAMSPTEFFEWWYNQSGSQDWCNVVGLTLEDAKKHYFKALNQWQEAGRFRQSHDYQLPLSCLPL